MSRVRSRKSVLVCLLASSSLASGIGAASAQDAIALDPVVVQGESGAEGVEGGASGPFNGYVPNASVSATKGAAPLNETPQAVSVVGAEQIEDQAARTVGEATRYSPGIRSETFGYDPRNEWFLIRGFSSQISSYFLDGLQLQSSDTYATWKINPYLLDRIDVLRGPSSALYGGSNPGGLINLQTKRPTFRNGGEASVGVNEFGNVWSGVDMEGVNADGTLAYRLVTTGNVGDTEFDHIDDDRFAILPSLTWAPTADTTLTLYGQYSNDQSNGQNFLPYEGTVVDAPFGRIPRELFTGEPSDDKYDREQAMVGYEFEHRFNEWATVRQNLRYAHLETDILGFYGLGYLTPPTENSGLLSRGAYAARPELGLFTVDTQVELKAETGPLAHTFLLGFDYKRFDLGDAQAFTLFDQPADPIDVVNPVYGGSYDIPALSDTTTKQDQVGFYAQDTIEIGRLSLLLSGRYDDVSTDVTDNPTGARTDYAADALSGRAGIIYNFDNGIAPWASVSRSFLPLVGTDDVTGSPFDPEEGTQYEVGVKYQPASWGNSLVGVSFFDLTRENFVTSDGVNFSRQIGKVNSQGVELEAVGQITRDLKAIAAYTWYDLEIEEGSPFEVGKEVAGVPDSFASLWLDYDIPSTWLQGVSLGGGVRYVSDSYADAANTREVDDVVLFDAAVRYETESFEAAVNASNLFNEDYVASCNSLNSCYYGEGRRVNLTLTYKW